MNGKDLISIYKLKDMPIFKNVSERFFNRITSAFNPIQISCGETLFVEGDLCNNLFLIAGGRLRLPLHREKEKIFLELGRGALIGELAALTKAPRQTSAYAVRDTLLLSLTKESFDNLLEEFPHELIELIAPSILRLSKTNKLQNSYGSREILFYFDDPSMSKAVVEMAKNMLQKYGSCKVVSRECLSKDLYNIDIQSDKILSDVNFIAWFINQSVDYVYNIYQVEKDFTNWGKKCCRECDRALIFCRAEKIDELQKQTYDIIKEAERVNKTIDIVLIHPEDTKLPSQTKRWLQKFPDLNIYHIRENSKKDLARVIRLVSGNGVSLALWGGGAPSLVQLGLLKAIDELGIPVDSVAGTSSGSYIAALIAMDYSPSEIIEIIKYMEPQGTRKWLDFTIPIISLAKGIKKNNSIKDLFKDLLIEDLWIQFFAVSTNLYTNKVYVPREGKVWEAVGFSTGIPIIYPPLTNDEGELIVDGAILNNQPVDIIQKHIKPGRVITSFMETPKLRKVDKNYAKKPLWKFIKNKINRSNNNFYLSILDIIHRLMMMSSRVHSANISNNADFCVKFPPCNIGLFENTPNNVDHLVEIGYRRTMESAAELEKFASK